MSKKKKLSQEDKEAFLQAVKGAKPILHHKIRLTRPLPAPKPIQHDTKEETFSFDESQETESVSGRQLIAYKQASISHKMLRNLRKGQYNVEAILDLHGMSVDKARTETKRFLHQCLGERMRVVLIIHGKGKHEQMPILKNKLNHWLRTINVVLAFCSALPLHGGYGATYVLLKRITEET